MTSLKAGAWLALAFAAGGGAGAYWFAPSQSERSVLPPPDDLREAADAQNDSVKQREQRSRDAQLAPSAHGSSLAARSTDEQSAEGELDGRSAADILWALEQAYQSQEARIRSLEMALQTQADEAQAEEMQADPMQADPMQAETESVGAVASLATSETVAPASGQSTGLGAPRDFTSPQEFALPREQSQRVASVGEPAHEPVDGAAVDEHQAALLAQQQLVIVNHYQPVFLSAPAPIRTSGRSSGLPPNSATSVFEPSRMQTRQDVNQRSPTTSSWVASGFDVYSR